MSRLVYDYNLFSYLHNCVVSVASINGKIIPLSKNRKITYMGFYNEYLSGIGGPCPC